MIAVVRSAITPELIAFFRILIAEHERRAQLAGVVERARREAGAPDVVSLLAPFIDAVGKERNVEFADTEHWVILLLRLAASSIQFDILSAEFTPSQMLVRTHVRLIVDIFVNGALPVSGGRAALPDGYDEYPWGPAFERATDP
ncbi:MAG: hypothetical protein HIU81_07345 [Acidobacteria bacterium]|nr:hypothetical protein [Acidobacteriota bacterium]